MTYPIEIHCEHLLVACVSFPFLLSHRNDGSVVKLDLDYIDQLPSATLGYTSKRRWTVTGSPERVLANS